jgi:hypothetical protein
LQEEEEWYVKDAKREVPTIKPLSEKMKEWFPIQWEIYKNGKQWPMMSNLSTVLFLHLI